MFRRPLFLSTFVFVACGGGSERGASHAPAATVTAASTMRVKGPMTGPVTPAACGAYYADGPAWAHCRWTVGSTYYCGGPAPTAEMMKPREVCMCNGCLTDTDCGDGGRCRAFRSYGCTSDAHACVKPGDECFEPKSCAQGCSHDFAGHVKCQGFQPPMP